MNKGKIVKLLLALVSAAAASGAATTGAAWFTEITDQVGLRVVPPTDPYDGMWLPDVMSAGAALFDYDGDGDLDIYLTNTVCVLPATDEMPRPGNLLFRREADGTYADVTVRSGLSHRRYGIGVAVGDYDNDGDADLYAANFGQDLLFRNRGNGTFEDVTREAGVEAAGFASSCAFFDYDDDGFLDIYVVQYVHYDRRKNCTDPAGRPDFCGPKMFPPAPDVLLHNEGNGTFRDVSRESGIASSSAAGLGVVCEDLDDDGRIDVYAANDAYANNLWINQGDGTFLDDAVILGAAMNEHGAAEAGMGVVAADFDNDGDFDLFLTHLKKESNTLYENLGGGLGFLDATYRTGLGELSAPLTGFGTIALDVELDGDLDLFVGNGAVNRSEPLAGVEVGIPWSFYAEPNQFLLNDGTMRFAPLGAEAGALCEKIEMTRATATGDIDSDGDLDLLIANVHGPARLYRNDAPRRGHWLRVRAVDPALDRDAIGATVTVHCGRSRFLRPVTRAMSYLSSSEPIAHFGLGAATSADSIVVRWPGGGRERFPATSADRTVELLRGAGETES